MLNTTLNRATNTSPWRRLGKIKLGIKAKSPSGAEYPKDVDYFVIPDEYKAALGEKPQELRISLAFPELESNFTTKAAMYKQNGARACWTNDDALAHRYMQPEGSAKYQWTEMVCPNVECEFRKTKKCTERGEFSFMIPESKAVGTFFLKTGSKVGIDRILTALQSLNAMTQGRTAGMLGLRMILRRELTVFNVDTKGDGTLTRIEKWIPTLDIDWEHLLAPDKERLAPFTGQVLALAAATVARVEDLEEREDEEDEPKEGAKP